ncbi:MULTISPECIES: ABC transporter permease [unclassified Oceanispirochaeta]|uniref:ABC transporter permease n=1 Tax=unclassified Oceanispirochaeta TaxID=2635722 RepID=UPI001314C1AB|nr:MULTISPECIES: FtsX-like permease family protein [unclassified Oceanispirochaeta]MBF9016780.1 ABC transporter permease [Oceanispirochaeta sp. M2]NPD72050.1 ABC transporter permease [Oceanispirochaeta sp. M1]
MKLFKLSFMNLFRYHKRTFITASALAYGILMFIFIDSFMAGSSEESFRNYRIHDTGDGQVLAAGWWEHRDDLSLDYVIEDRAIVETALKETEVFTPHLDFTADFLFYKSDGFVEDGDLPVVVRAIDTETAPLVFQQYEDIVDGRMIESDENSVLLGSWFAEKLGATVGAPILLQVKTRYGSTDVIELEVTGIIHTGDSALNRKAIYIPLFIADEYLEMEGAITGYTVLAKDKVLESLSAGLDGSVRFLDYYELTYDFQSMAAMSDSFIVIIIALIFIIASVGVSNTMMMGIYERKYEVGMMRSLGMTDGEIMKSFILEAMGIGLIGLSIGIFLAIPLNIFLVNHGIDYGFMLKDFDVGYRTTGVLHGRWKASSFIYSALAGISISGIMAIIPARRILKKPISENLRMN